MDYINKLKAIIDGESVIACDTETQGLDFYLSMHKIIGLSFATSKGAIYIPVRHKNPASVNCNIDELYPFLIENIFKNLSITKLWYNYKFDYQALRMDNLISLNNIDLFVWVHLYFGERQKVKKLKTVMRERYGVNTESLMLVDAWLRNNHFKSDNKQYAEVPFDIISKYATDDVEYLLILYNDLQPKLSNSVCNTIEQRLVVDIAEIEKRGHYIDKTSLTAIKESLIHKNAEIDEKLFKEYGVQETLNINSARDVNDYITKELGLLPLPTTKKGNYSISYDALNAYQNPILDLIVEKRRNEKIAVTFCDNILSRLDANNRLHASFQQMEAGTGRMSCREPNLQNIPKGVGIRSCFMAKHGYTLIQADYSQQEYRVFCHYANKFIAEYTTDPSLDYHQLMADKLGISRSIVKTLNFAVLYGTGIESIAALLHITVAEATTIYTEYHIENPEIKIFSQKVSDIARKRGWIKTIAGRKRFFTVHDKFYKALNSLIQGSSADITKMAVSLIANELYENGEEASIVNIIHDEIVTEVPIDRVEIIKDIVIYNMKEAGEKLGLRIPLMIDVKINKRWDDG